MKWFVFLWKNVNSNLFREMSRFSFNIEILALLTLRDSGVSYYMEAQGGSNWAPPSKMHFKLSNPKSFLHIKRSIYEKLKSRRRGPQIHISGIYGYTKNLPNGHRIGKIKIVQRKMVPLFCLRAVRIQRRQIEPSSFFKMMRYWHTWIIIQS